jgi:hypothetical protein
LADNIQFGAQCNELLFPFLYYGSKFHEQICLWTLLTLSK